MYFDLFLDFLGNVISPSCPVVGKYDNEKNSYAFPLLKGVYEFCIFVEPKGNNSVLIQIAYNQQTKLTCCLDENDEMLYNENKWKESVYGKWLSSPDYDASIQDEIKNILFIIYMSFTLCVE